MTRTYLFILITFKYVTTSCSEKNESDPESFQAKLKEYYNNPDTTPLNAEETKAFKGLDFFPIDQKYAVEARFTPTVKKEVITFTTSANKTKDYEVAGTLHFTLEDKDCQLTLYTTPQSPGDLFLPFRDATSGHTSYGAGRYIDLKRTEIRQGKLLLDFNLAYNPYCAYSEQYSCPLPPEENTLQVAIEAGARFIHSSEE